jgi:hypothetical protein
MVGIVSSYAVSYRQLGHSPRNLRCAIRFCNRRRPETGKGFAMIFVPSNPLGFIFARLVWNRSLYLVRRNQSHGC